MSHFAYTRATWVTGTALTAGDMASLDAKTFKAINGDEGSTHAPSSMITIGGSGAQMKLVGASTIDAASLTAVNVSVVEIQNGSFLRIHGETHYYTDSFTAVDGTWRFRTGSSQELESGAALVADAGSTITVNGSFSVGSGGTAHFATGSTTTFDGTLNIMGGALFGSAYAAAFTGLVAFAGNTRIQAGVASLSIPLTCHLAGRVTKRPPVVIATASADITGIGPATADTLIIRGVTASLVTHVPIGLDGDEFTVVYKSVSTPMDVYDANTGFYVITLQNIVGGHRSVTLIQVAGAWEVLRAEPGGSGGAY